MVKASNGHGAYWTKAFAEADDYESGDGNKVLTFYEAQDRAKQLARIDRLTDKWREIELHAWRFELWLDLFANVIYEQREGGELVEVCSDITVREAGGEPEVKNDQPRPARSEREAPRGVESRS